MRTSSAPEAVAFDRFGRAQFVYVYVDVGVDGHVAVYAERRRRPIRLLHTSFFMGVAPIFIIKLDLEPSDGW